MYVAVKGGEKAIEAAHRLLAEERRGDVRIPEISLEQLREQLKLSVDRVMAEGSLYAPLRAALAVKQAQGDLQEAIFLLRAYRTTLPRFGCTEPLNTSAMQVERRISATWKDLPGGQVLGSTFDYTHRLLDRSLAEVKRDGRAAQENAAVTDRNAGTSAVNKESGTAAAVQKSGTSAVNQNPGACGIAPESGSAAATEEENSTHSASVSASAKGKEGAAGAASVSTSANAETLDEKDRLLMGALPRALEVLTGEGLLEPVETSCPEGRDITRFPLEMPADKPEDRSVRLQALARADEGFLLGMAYSVQRGFGATHPFTGELRRGTVECSFVPEELGFSVTVGEIELTECETVSQYTGIAKEPCFTRGYGLVFGNNERKALSMSITDRALRARELKEDARGPAQNPEFVLLHSDNVEASGFVQHIKLPHYVDFQAELSMIRGLRAGKCAGHGEATADGGDGENCKNTADDAQSGRSGRDEGEKEL